MIAYHRAVAASDFATRPPTLQHLTRAVCASHASLWRVLPGGESLAALAVDGMPFAAAGMAVPATVRDGADPEPLFGTVGGTHPIAELATASGVKVLRWLQVHDLSGALRAMLLLGWAEGPVPGEPDVLHRFAEALPSLQALVVEASLAAPAIMVLHEHELVAHGIARRIEAARGLQVVASSDPSRLEAALAGDRPWIVICSDHLADGTTLTELTARARRAREAVQVIALAGSCTPASVAEARAAKADGFATVAPGLEQLLGVLDAVRAGVATPLPSPDGVVLTKREQQLLRGLDEGLTYQEIANRLGITLSTVKTQSRPLFRKLEVTSRAGAVHKARAQGLL